MAVEKRHFNPGLGRKTFNWPKSNFYLDKWGIDPESLKRFPHTCSGSKIPIRSKKVFLPAYKALKLWCTFLWGQS